MMILLNDLKNIYFKYNLEEKLSLAFLFNSGTVRSMIPNTEMISGSDIIKILNSSDENLKHISRDDETKSSNNIFKFILLAILLVLAAFIVYGFVKKGNRPLEVERIELSKYDKNVETAAAEENSADKTSSSKQIADTGKKTAPSSLKKTVPMMKITINSNIPGVRVFNKESGKTICKAPCSKKFPKKEDGVIVLGFEYEDYSIEPMTVTLDKDMIVNLNLKQETENE